MRFTNILRVAVLSAIFLVSYSIVSAQFSGGSGIPDDPYLIGNVEDLNLIRDYPESHFRQIDNIDLDVEPWNDNEGWLPVGTANEPFRGTYDGAEYVIQNLFIHNEMGRNVGLFGYVLSGNILNVELLNVSVLGFVAVGGLAGYIDNSSVTDCSVSGEVEGINYYTGGLIGLSQDSEIRSGTSFSTVTGYGDVGGLVGANNESLLMESFSRSEVYGEFNVGGLVGNNASGDCCIRYQTGGLAGFREDTIIEKSSSMSTVNGVQAVGGLVGNNDDAAIYDSYAMGNTFGDNYVGGLAGVNYNGTIDISYAKGNVSGNIGIGGLVGFNMSDDNDFGRLRTRRGTKSKNIGYRNGSSILNSYAKGAVDGTLMVGGLVGENIDSAIENCYSTGSVTGEESVGGLVGHFPTGTIIHSYWDTETSGLDVSAAGEAKNSDEMTYPYEENTYVEWDFEEIWAYDVSGTINEGYPIFIWQDTYVNPHPNIAVNPYPENEATDISVQTDSLRWMFIKEEGYAIPQGFKIYLNLTGTFDEESGFWWVDFGQDSTLYSVSIDELLPLDYDSIYYWKVVPTTIHPDNRRDRTSYRPYYDAGTGPFIQPVGTGYHTVQRKEKGVVRNDAEEVPVWSFTTEIDTNVDLPPIPITTKLHQNYPNPFNPATKITFTIAVEGQVIIEIYNSRGQRVNKLIDDYLPAGEHSVIWHGTDELSNSLASGIYLYRMRSESYDSSGKMIMIK